MIKNLAVGGGSNKLLLVSALVLGLLAAVLIGVYLSSLDSDGGSGSTTNTATVPVVVATQDIPAATTITAEMVAVKAIPTDLALLGAFTETAAAVGQTTQVAISANEQIVPAKVASAGTAVDQFGPEPPLSVIVPEGKRAYAIAVSDVAAAGGLIRAGDHVDVLLTVGGGSDDSGNETDASTCFVLQNMQVLAVATTLSQTTSETDANGIAGVDAVPGASTMTLAAAPNEAGALAIAEESGTLSLALRKFSDHNVAGDVPACSFNAPAS